MPDFKPKQEKEALLSRFRKNIALVGEAAKMVSLKQLIARVAPTQSWVLLQGENGAGKELTAQNIHYLSPRASRPFVEVNCATLRGDQAMPQQQRPLRLEVGRERERAVDV